jgi:hypothetical protein
MAATYQRTNWVDEAVQYPNRYAEQQLSGGLVNLTPDPGEVDTVGTPQSANNFNHMECGILDENIAFSLFALHQQLMTDKINSQADETTPEIGTVTLTNTAKFPFSNSKQTVTLVKRRKTLNYEVAILSAVASDAKPIGDILIANRQLNGFSIQYSGSSASVTISYRITGGITV